MLPTGMFSAALIWAYGAGGFSMSTLISCWQQGAGGERLAQRRVALGLRQLLAGHSGLLVRYGPGVWHTRPQRSPRHAGTGRIPADGGGRQPAARPGRDLVRSLASCSRDALLNVVCAGVAQLVPAADGSHQRRVSLTRSSHAELATVPGTITRSVTGWSSLTGLPFLIGCVLSGTGISQQDQRQNLMVLQRDRSDRVVALLVRRRRSVSAGAGRRSGRSGSGRRLSCPSPRGDRSRARLSPPASSSRGPAGRTAAGSGPRTGSPGPA